jgi:drug/metabolite transporter (DMT)-like permease
MRGRWLVFTAAALWGTSATLARYVFRDRQVPALVVVELRLVFAVAMLAVWLAWHKPAALRVDRRDWAYFLTLGVFGVATVQGSYYYSISRLGVGLAILLQYLAPTLIVLYDLVRGRRVSGLTAAAALLALGGTALLVVGVDVQRLHARPLDWAIGFGSAFTFAFYILYSKRGIARYELETMLLYTFAVAAVLWAFVTPPWRIVAANYDGSLWAMFLTLGFFSTLAPFAFFYAGLKRLSSTEAGIVATLEPVIAVLSAALFLHEGLDARQWLGAMLVLGASIMASMRRPETGVAQAERG